MGFLSMVGNAIGRGVGWLGNGLRKVGDIGMGIVKRVGEFAPQIGSAVGGLIGNNPVGNFVSGLGKKVGDFANGTGQAIAKGVSDIGSSLGGIGNALTSGNTNNGMKGA